MKRAHQRDVLMKNKSAYYNSVENMINLSPYRKTLLECIPHVLDNSKYTIIVEDGQEILCLKKLLDYNDSQISVAINDGEQEMFEEDEEI